MRRHMSPIWRTVRFQRCALSSHRWSVHKFSNHLQRRYAEISTPQIVPISHRCPTCTYKCKVIERVEIRSLSETPIIHATPLVMAKKAGPAHIGPALNFRVIARRCHFAGWVFCRRCPQPEKNLHAPATMKPLRLRRIRCRTARALSTRCPPSGDNRLTEDFSPPSSRSAVRRRACCDALRKQTARGAASPRRSRREKRGDARNAVTTKR